MNYYNEVENCVKTLEINENTRRIASDFEKVKTYYEIGRLIVEAQGGELRAKYGNELIKEWSIKLTSKYGKNYSSRNLRKMRQFFEMWPTVSANLSWSHIVELLPIKDENKRNYYINICIERNLSIRDLRQEIKDESYERIINKPERIEIIGNKDNKYEIENYIKNPIIIKLNKEEQILKEEDLKIILIAKLQVFFKELGMRFTLVGSNYKINNKNNRIDILLFNYKINSFVVVELKLRELRSIDKGQIEFYMKEVDRNIKEKFHDKTIGIIITKKQDKLIAEFIKQDNIIPINYLIKK